MMQIRAKNLSGLGIFGLLLITSISFTACKKQESGDGAPPEPQVQHVSDMNLISVDANKVHQFPLQAAEKLEEASQLSATGSVNPDVSREIPVISLANGRVVDIKARLDDYVKKGDLLIKVQSPDVSGAYDTYLKAVNDEQLANKAYLRSKELFDHGAISQATLEQAEDTEKDAQADLTAAEENLKTLGVDKNHPNSLVNVYAPISGVIIAQNVTQAAAAGVTLSGTATAFTIADLSTVWIICDVFENDISKIHLGQSAQIHINAYPDKVLTGRISDIGPVLDPSIRTAKVRLEVPNPGILKLGMFVTATFESKTLQTYTAVPSTAVLHLHDRDWVFVPAGSSQFKRTEVRGGRILPSGKQEILSGLTVGQQVVTNALDLESTVSQ
ncbi:efflux RND transporter periplasmic adaptor subunit [Acidicapsa acidisoli]|uniref:efflux RND transporter periplasmic adaptor subunit n=1 Tax=Acidicapsa acidisoli TaxID=1615681 RepID=UPI0021E0FB9D|nr:efflux RND transporter periplasmic adaptor subunit [Acidicapsa acidisoli]